MVVEVDDVEGQPGELIERLVEIIDGGVTTDGAWHDLGEFATLMLSGHALARSTPDTGRDFAPGTVGALQRERYEVVSRADWFSLIRDRLEQLVHAGLDEAFLIRALRDELRRHLEFFANAVAGQPDRKADLERIAENPAEIAALRARVAEHHPEEANLSDQEAAAMLRRLAAMTGPASAEVAVDRWTALAQWDDQVSRRLSDVVVDEWRNRFVQRLTGPKRG